MVYKCFLPLYKLPFHFVGCLLVPHIPCAFPSLFHFFVFLFLLPGWLQMTHHLVCRLFLLLDQYATNAVFCTFYFIHCIPQLQNSCLFLLCGSTSLLNFLFCPYIAFLLSLSCLCCLIVHWASWKQFFWIVRCVIDLHFSGVGCWKIVLFFWWCKFLRFFIVIILLYSCIAVCAFERAVMFSRLYGLASMGKRSFIYEWIWWHQLGGVQQFQLK